MQQLQAERADHHAGDTADAAQHDHDENHDRDREHEHLRRGRLPLGHVEGSRHTGEARTDGKGEQLEFGTVDPHRLGSDFVLAYGKPGPADARMFQPCADEDQQDDKGEPKVVVGRGHHTEIVAEEFRRSDAAEALRAIGDVGRVACHDWHDLGWP